MSEETMQFMEMVREALLEEEIHSLWCEQCGGQRGFVFKRETALEEIYGCMVCGCERVFVVR